MQQNINACSHLSRLPSMCISLRICKGRVLGFGVPGAVSTCTFPPSPSYGLTYCASYEGVAAHPNAAHPTAEASFAGRCISVFSFFESAMRRDANRLTTFHMLPFLACSSWVAWASGLLEGDMLYALPSYRSVDRPKGGMWFSGWRGS